MEKRGTFKSLELRFLLVVILMFKTLQEYSISLQFQGKPLLNIERSGCGLFGMMSYGTHINGFVVTKRRDDSSDNDFDEIKMWMSKRSLSKPTWPGMMDNLVAGGLPSGSSPGENVLKECMEEASIPKSLSVKAVAASKISYFAYRSRGLFRETQFVYDLLLPENFEPSANDGEVEDFYLKSIDEVYKRFFVGK